MASTNMKNVQHHTTFRDWKFKQGEMPYLQPTDAEREMEWQKYSFSAGWIQMAQGLQGILAVSKQTEQALLSSGVFLCPFLFFSEN